MDFVDIVTSCKFTSASNLTCVIGQSDKKIVLCDFNKYNSIVIGGNEKQGKTNLILGVILSLLLKNKSSYLKLLIATLKQGDENKYSIFEKLSSVKFIDYETFNYILKYLIREIEIRSNLFKENHVTGIDEFNNLSDVKSGKLHILPYAVLIIDELDDFFNGELYQENMSLFDELTEKASFYGIFLVVASKTSQNLSFRLKSNAMCVCFNVDNKLDAIYFLGDTTNAIEPNVCLMKDADGSIVKIDTKLIDYNIIGRLLNR